MLNMYHHCSEYLFSRRIKNIFFSRRKIEKEFIMVYGMLFIRNWRKINLINKKRGGERVTRKSGRPGEDVWCNVDVKPRKITPSTKLRRRASCYQSARIQRSPSYGIDRRTTIFSTSDHFLPFRSSNKPIDRI